MFEWNIAPLTNGTMYDAESLVLSYNISNRAYRLDVFDHDCAAEIEGSLYHTDVVNSLGHGYMNVTTLIAIDQTTIEDNSAIWSNTTDGGQIQFCVRMTLLMQSDEEDIAINVDEARYTINVDKTTGFDLTDITLERTAIRVGGTVDIDYEVNIAAFQCEDNYSELSPIPALTQGDLLQVCVKVEDANSTFKVEYIKDLTITQNGNSNSPILVVRNGTDFTFDELTFSECDGGYNQICRMKFQLFVSFFDNSVPPYLTVSGVVKLKLKLEANNNRNLDESQNIRSFRDEVDQLKVRELDVTVQNGFALDVALSNDIESSNWDKRKGVNFATLLMLIGGGIYAFW